MQSARPKVSATVDALMQTGLLDRLPVTFSAYWFEQFRDWDLLFPAELPVGADRMWMRLRKQGIALPVEVPDNPDDYLPLLLTGSKRMEQAPSIADLYAAHRSDANYHAWMIETGEVLASLGPGHEN